MEECKQDDTRCHQQYLFKQMDGNLMTLYKLLISLILEYYPPGLAFVGFQRYSND